MEEDYKLDREYKFSLGYCKILIKSYKRFYMRKNSKYPAVIQLRCHHLGLDRRFWKYYLELWVNKQMASQEDITPEAYDALSCDDSLKKEEFKNLEFITLHEFKPKKIE